MEKKGNIVKRLAEAEADSRQVPKAKKNSKARTTPSDRSLSNREVEDNTEEGLGTAEVEQLGYIQDLLNANQVALCPTPPTKGDGNCWFRALADQVELQDIPGKARNYKSLRLEVRSDLAISVLV